MKKLSAYVYGLSEKKRDEFFDKFVSLVEEFGAETAAYLSPEVDDEKQDQIDEQKEKPE
jgi:hypothetical protein